MTSADEQDAPVSGEGLTEAEKDWLRPLSVHATLGWPHWLFAAVERILAAREAAWAKDRAELHRELEKWEALAYGNGWQYDQASARAESAEAALATALREKAEAEAERDQLRVAHALAHSARARLEARVEAVEALRPTGEREWHNQGRSGVALTVDYRAVRAALAVPTATGDGS